MSRTRQSAPLLPVGLRSPLVAQAADYEPGTVIDWHRHEVAQLICASAGVMTVTTEDGTWVVPRERASGSRRTGATPSA